MTTLYDQIAEQGALFNVRKEPVFTESGLKIPGKQAIINEKTGEPLSIVSKNYRVVTNDEVMTNIQEAFNKSKIDLTGATAEAKFSHFGARTMVDIRIPSVSIQMKEDQSPSNLQVTVLNSYDGRWKYQVRAGAIRMACMNGQILGDFVGTYTEYHNARLDVETSSGRIIRMADQFDSAQEWWIKMINRSVSEDQLYRAIHMFLKGSADVKDKKSFKENRSTMQLVSLFDKYSVEMGRNAYALYSAMTDFVTHKKRREETHAAGLLSEQKRLQSTLGKAKLFAL